MNGQWRYEIGGDRPGQMILDVDHLGDHYEGYAFIIYDHAIPGMLAQISTKDLSTVQKISTPIDLVNPTNSTALNRADVEQAYPGQYPSTLTATLTLKSRALHVDWETDLGRRETLKFPKSEATRPSAIRPDRSIRTWTKFKEYCASLEPNRFIFRGQGGTWRLRTAFHRTGRRSFIRYRNFDLPELHRALTGRTKHFFDLTDGDQFGAFLNLAQHHGFPTPLLDWSRSPFVAAFFAYRDARWDINDQGPVRIFVFDQAAWRRDFRQLISLMLQGPHISLLNPYAIENERALPQQALSMVTNLDDVEGYIVSKMIQRSTKYLTVIDLPYRERLAALRELAMMGITSGSLFPGLDGACRELRERLFDHA